VDTLTVDNSAVVSNPIPLIRYQYRDHLGSAAMETNENGQVISYEEYHPFGTSAYRVAKSGTDLSLKRYRFTGKERDDETGLYYFGVRHYAAWLGRWTSSDPGGFVDGLNLYVYVRNNPVMLVDEEGYAGEPPPEDNTIPPKTYSTPDKGTVTLPTEANVQFFKNDYTTIAGDDSGKKYNVLKGSVSGFSIGGESFSAFFNTETGEFDGYYTGKREGYGLSYTQNNLPEHYVDNSGTQKAALVIAPFALSPDSPNLLKEGTEFLVGLGITTLALASMFYAWENISNSIDISPPAISFDDVLAYSPPYIPPISFTDDEPIVGTLPDLPNVKIALGLNHDLIPFAINKKAVRWFNFDENGNQTPGWGQNMTSQTKTAEIITALGLLPNIEFHFNLTGTSYGRLDTPEVLEHYNKDRSFTATEYITIMNNPILRAKTTFWIKEKGVYLKTTPFSLPPSLKK
jgi:RHS repeat-associated protein